MEPKRFYRSTKDKKIAGVAGGLGEYFELDPLLARLIFVILALAGGGGVLIYIILWIVTPEKPFDPYHQQNHSTMENKENPSSEPKAPGETPPQNPVAAEPRSRGNLIGGLVLITLGVLFLADEFIPNINFGDLWPIILIVIGAGLLIKSLGRKRS
jgi:phage shock protein C